MRKYLSAVFFYDRIHIPDDSAFGVATTAVDTLWFGLFQANVLTLSPAAAKASILVSSWNDGLLLKDLTFGFFFGFSLICFNQLSKSLDIFCEQIENPVV